MTVRRLRDKRLAAWNELIAEARAYVEELRSRLDVSVAVVAV